MKKFLLSALCVLTAMASMAETRNYTESLVVDVNGNATDPTPANVQVVMNGDKIDFTLNDLYLPGDPDNMPVGNISLSDIPATAGEGGVVNFSITTDVVLTEGTDPSVEWMGPTITMLCGGQVPLTLTGKLNSSHLYVHIDLDLTAQMGQVIKVELGEEGNVVPEAPAGQGSGIFMRGSFNSWGTSAEAEFLTTATAGVYTIQGLTLANGTDGFKVADASWSDACNFGGNGSTLELGAEYALVAGGGNIKFPTGKEYNCSLITLDLNKQTLTVVGTEGGETTVTVTSLATPGSFNEWDVKAGAMTYNATSGLWTSTSHIAAGQAHSFKFAANGGWDVNYGAQDSANNATLGESFPARLGGENIFFDLEAEADVTFSLALAADNKSGTYTVSTDVDGVTTILASGSVKLSYGLDGRKAQQGILIQEGKKILK